MWLFFYPEDGSGIGDRSYVSVFHPGGYQRACLIDICHNSFIPALLFAFDIPDHLERHRGPLHTVLSATHSQTSFTRRCNTIKYLHNLSTAAIGPKRLHFPNENLEGMFFDDRRDVTRNQRVGGLSL